MGYCPDALYQHVLSDTERYRNRHPEFSYASSGQFRSYYDAALRSLESSITKKYVSRERSSSCRKDAVSLFLAMNDHCSSIHIRQSELIAQMRYTAFRELPALDWSSIFHHGRNGPGASVSSRGCNSSFEKFFVNKCTTTSPSLYKEYRDYLRKFPSWLSADLRRSMLHDGKSFEVVTCSKLSTVPKNDSIDRTICTEPSLNMFAQLGLGELINNALRSFYGYNPALQPDRNRKLACYGSLGKHLDTIDLSSASDSISLSLCELVLPADWFAAILDCRSPSVDVDGRLVTLNMVSSMGNGFTFPLQTYIFSLLIKCLCKILDVKWARYDSVSYFGVFGDDIIVPASLSFYVVEALTSLGFKPNLSKCFFGPEDFRESCGTDWYSGRDVRGVYCRGLSTLPDRLSLANRLLRWSAKHRVSVTNTIQYVLPSDWRRFTVPSDCADTAGLKVPFYLTHKKDFKHQQFSPRRKLFRALTSNGMLKPSHNNPLGFLLEASAGRLRSSGLDRKVSQVRYSKVFGDSPYWARSLDLKRNGINFVDWETLCWVNLTG